MRTSIRSVLLLISGFAIIFASIAGVLRFKQRLEDSIINSYRLTCVGQLMLEYKDATGKWPHDWDDLESHAKLVGFEFYTNPNFEELRDNIRIDFSIDLETINTNVPWSELAPQIEVVKAKTGQTYGATLQPNEAIYRQLQVDAALQDKRYERDL